jgi:DNA-directed RNA polymerase subunit M/transcription elongation factor TFIIS
MPLRALQTPATPVRREATEQKKGGKPPLCPKCGTPMVWFNTDLKRDNGSRLVHTFHCQACGEIAQIEEPWRARLRMVPFSN